jgi:peptide/nickel transport system permease protein
VICMSVGTVLAISSAWRKGAYDTVVSSGLDVLFAFPAILLAILAATVFGAGLMAAVLALAIAYTPYVARVLRGAALRERSQQYVDALSVQGLSAFSICMRHLIPNMAPLIVAQATILFGYAMVDLAAISFLGLGVQPPNPDWGVMVSENQSGLIQGYPVAALSAGLCIVIVVVAFNVLGERLYEQAQRERR